MTVFGTRPEAIKMAPVVKELQKHADSIQTVVAVTAQHRQMLDQVLELFRITPDYDLDIMPRARPYTILRRSRFWVSKMSWPKNNRIWSSFTGIRRRPLPGPGVLLSADPRRPRRSRPSDRGYLFAVPGRNEPQAHRGHCGHSFCPDSTARANLVRENIDPSQIYVTGNTVIDALMTTVPATMTSATN